MTWKSWREQVRFISIFTLILIGLLVLVLGSCDNILEAVIRAAGAYAQKDLLTFGLPAALNSGAGLTTDCVGVITGSSISVTLPYIPDVTSLVATFTSTGVEVRVGSTVQVSGVTPNDFTSPATYVVVAEDSTTKSYTVTVTVAANTAKDITAFRFEAARNSGAGLTTDCVGNIASVNISVTVPYIPDVTSLVATFATTGEEVRVGSTVQVSGVTPNDFTNPVTYIVVAADSTTKNYSVSVSVAANPTKDLTSFSFPASLNSGAGIASDCAGVIAGTDISVTVPYGASVTSLLATFTTTGVEVRVGSTVQVSGVTPNDFTNPVKYVVIAEDSSTKSYTVTVTNNWETVGPAGFSTGEVSYVSLALDSSGIPYVAYQDFSNSGKATVMKYDSGSWQSVGAPGFSAGGVMSVSLALDSSDTPYVAYRDLANSNKATVMKYDSGSWQIVGTAGFSSGGTAYNFLALDSSGYPYVAYMDMDFANNDKATVMKYESGSWQVVGAAGFSAGAVEFVCLAMDSSGIPYVAYKDNANNDKATVMKYDSGSWQVVGAAGFSVGSVMEPSLALDSSGNPYVAYRDWASDHKATVMKYDSGSWQVVGTAGFSAGTASQTSLAIDSSDIPYVAFEDGRNSGKATVMKYDSGSWQNVGAPGFSADRAENPSLALDSSGTPYVAFKDWASSRKATVMKP